MNYGLEELSNRFFNGVGVKHLQRFHDVTTPEGHVLEGVICRAHNHYLGSLVITHVDGEEALQFVQSMPKIHYADENSIDIDIGITAYEKLDGTCIIMYPLLDNDRNVLEVLFKTRGTVVADKHILKMVKQCNTRRYEELLYNTFGFKFYFELYGMENLHTIRHNKIIDMDCIAQSNHNEFVYPINTAFTANKIFEIYKIGGDYEVRPNQNKKLYGYLPSTPYCCNTVEECYQYMADALEDCNTKYIEDFGYPAIEGVVLQGYNRDANYHFLKVKPKTIRSGCYDSGKVPINSIAKEIFKLFDEYNLEEIKEKTVEDNGWYLPLVNENLKEEFTGELIMNSQKRIKRHFQKVWEFKLPAKGDNDIAQDLVKKYPTLTVKELMRKFGLEYPHKKGRSSKIYQILTHLVKS